MIIINSVFDIDTTCKFIVKMKERIKPEVKIRKLLDRFLYRNGLRMARYIIAVFHIKPFSEILRYKIYTMDVGIIL